MESEDIGLELHGESNIQKTRFQVQIIATTEKFEFVLQPYTVQCSAHISSFRSPNAPIFFLESWDNFLGLSWQKYIQILKLAMMFCSDKKIRIVTKSGCGHPFNN